MVEKLKGINKKGLIVIVGIFSVIFLIIIVVALTRACGKPGSNYTKVEKKMVSATEKYLKQYPDAKPQKSKNVQIDIDTLVEHKYMKKLSSYLKDTSCKGNTTVYNNSGEILIVPYLECAEYKTLTLADKIKKDNLYDNVIKKNGANVIVEENDYISALYLVDDVYVFKGKNPNNFLSFSNTKWRIIDIDKNGLIRAIKVDSEKKSVRWDEKYNVEVKDSKGINDYKNSALLEDLNGHYNKFKNQNKKHLLPMNVCIGKRNDSSLGLERSLDCSEVLQDQYISVINVGDYSRASLDHNCNSIVTASCINYNYFRSIVTQTWTTNAFADNTYKAIAINGGTARAFETREMLSVNWVVAFNGNEKYIEGNGTEKKPYVIKVNK